MARLTYALKRILQMIPVLLVVVIFIFFLIRLLPGDPARILLGEQALEADVESLRRQMGLDRSIWEQFFIFMKDLLRFDFGNSLVFKMPVMDLIKQRWPLTVMLTLFTAAIATLVSIPLGFIAGLNKDKASDQIVRVIALGAVCMPSFWVGLLLMMVFGVWLGWLPVGGWGETAFEHFKALILPAISLSMTTMALLMRDLRNSVVNISAMDYVDFAKSKGLSEGRVRKNYILRNSLLSTITILSTRIGEMLGGSMVIETVFALPGIGSLLVNSIFGRDYALLQALVFFFALLVMVVNLLTDIVYSFVDPRITL